MNLDDFLVSWDIFEFFSLLNWINKSVSEKERSVIPEDAYNAMASPRDQASICDYLSLVNRIIEYVAGMTDRYIVNEYNRINQTGREFERQDETYFFY